MESMREKPQLTLDADQLDADIAAVAQFDDATAGYDWVSGDDDDAQAGGGFEVGMLPDLAKCLPRQSPDPSVSDCAFCMLQFTNISF